MSESELLAMLKARLRVDIDIWTEGGTLMAETLLVWQHDDGERTPLARDYAQCSLPDLREGGA
jgi:hypothetical protein